MKKYIFCSALCIAIASIALPGCAEREQEAVIYPSDQREFSELNARCRAKFAEGINEIQKSLVFNECNSKRLAFSNEHAIRGWVGKLSDISTDQGANVVSVTIDSTIDGFDTSFGTVNNRISDLATESLIRPNNPLFNKLSQMKVGELVSFYGTFLSHPERERGIWESSLTEQGSMDDPEFSIRFSDIEPYGAAVPGQHSQSLNAEEGPAATVPARPIAGAGNEIAQDDLVEIDDAPNEAECTRIFRWSTKEDMKKEFSWYKANCENYELPPNWKPGSETKLAQNSPSFDCKKAITRVENMICANSDLAELDRDLAHAYYLVLSSSNDQKATKGDQINWVNSERDACDDSTCLRSAYRDRIEHLNSLHPK